jgi:hypothetical protein
MYDIPRRARRIGGSLLQGGPWEAGGARRKARLAPSPQLPQSILTRQLHHDVQCSCRTGLRCVGPSGTSPPEHKSIKHQHLDVSALPRSTCCVGSAFPHPEMPSKPSAVPSGSRRPSEAPKAKRYGHIDQDADTQQRKLTLINL